MSEHRRAQKSTGPQRLPSSRQAAPPSLRRGQQGEIGQPTKEGYSYREIYEEQEAESNMSAESKKKHGESGRAHAKGIPFRYHGYPRGYSLSTMIGASSRFAGSAFLNAMILGARLPRFSASDRMYRAADEAIDRIEAKGHKVAA